MSDSEKKQITVPAELLQEIQDFTQKVGLRGTGAAIALIWKIYKTDIHERFLGSANDP